MDESATLQENEPPTAALAEAAPPEYAAEESPPTYEASILDNWHRSLDHLSPQAQRTIRRTRVVLCQARLSLLQLHLRQLNNRCNELDHRRRRLQEQVIDYRERLQILQQGPPTFLHCSRSFLGFPNELTRQVLLHACGPNLLRRDCADLLFRLSHSTWSHPSSRGRIAVVEQLIHDDRFRLYEAQAPIWCTELHKYAQVCRLFDISPRLRTDVEWVERKWLQSGGYDRHFQQRSFAKFLAHDPGIPYSETKGIILTLFSQLDVPFSIHSMKRHADRWWELIRLMPRHVERVQLRNIRGPCHISGPSGLATLIERWLLQYRPRCQVEVVDVSDDRPRCSQQGPTLELSR